MRAPDIDRSAPEPRTDSSLLGQVETRFRQLSAADTVLDLNRIGIPALGWVRHVRRLLGHPDITHDQRDILWRDVLHFTRRTEPNWANIHGQQRHHRGIRTPQEWTIIALGLAMPGLRHAVRTRLGNPGPEDRDDIHADLITGFLTRMSTIDIRRRNICGRLIAAAVRHARARQIQRQRERAALPLNPDTATASSSNVDDVVDKIGTWQSLSRLPLHPADRMLIQMTRLEGHTLADAARKLGISLTAAASRRDRAEQRLAARYRRRRAPTSKTTGTTE